MNQEANKEANEEVKEEVKEEAKQEAGADAGKEQRRKTDRKREKGTAAKNWKERMMHGLLKTGGESRQRLWQLMNSAQGLCEMCSAPITHYPTMCDACAAKKRSQIQARRGLKPWRPGGKGRPPKVRPET